MVMIDFGHRAIYKHMDSCIHILYGDMTLNTVLVAINFSHTDCTMLYFILLSLI